MPPSQFIWLCSLKFNFHYPLKTSSDCFCFFRTVRFRIRQWLTAVLWDNQQAKWRRQEQPTPQNQAYTASSFYSNMSHATLRHKLTNAVILFVKLHQRRVHHACACFFKSSQHDITKRGWEALLAFFFSSCKTVCVKAFSIHGHFLSADLCGELLSAMLCSTDFSASQLKLLSCPHSPNPFLYL